MLARNICLWVFLSCSLLSTAQSEWLLIYVMPYDNDLSVYHEEIQNQLVQNRGESEIAIIKALPNELELTCAHWSKNDSSFWELSGMSISEEHLKSFLLQVGERSNAQKSAVFFLDHAGDENELGLDLNPEETWLSVSSAAEALKCFSQSKLTALELIYLQVCSKAHLDALSEFGTTSPFIMASVFPLGAPNSYYAGMLSEINKGMIHDGEELARSIVMNEDLEMFLSLSLFRTSALAQLTNEFHRLAQESDYQAKDFVSKRFRKHAGKENKQLRLVHYGKHKYADMSDVFALLFDETNANDLRLALQTSILWHVASPNAPEVIASYCGLSLSLPQKTRSLVNSRLSFWQTLN